MFGKTPPPPASCSSPAVGSNRALRAAALQAGLRVSCRDDSTAGSPTNAGFLPEDGAWPRAEAMGTGRFFSQRLARCGAGRCGVSGAQEGGLVISPCSQAQISPGCSLGFPGAWEGSCDCSRRPTPLDLVFRAPHSGGRSQQYPYAPSGSLCISLYGQGLPPPGSLPDCSSQKSLSVPSSTLTRYAHSFIQDGACLPTEEAAAWAMVPVHGACQSEQDRRH